MNLLEILEEKVKEEKIIESLVSQDVTEGSLTQYKHIKTRFQGEEYILLPMKHHSSLYFKRKRDGLYKFQKDA